ncbi:MAG TPA: hypothetical protein VK157_17535, partial [Phycisphaerales bacterium]|nr:hypothetical protein [Phycisphaerales bacterium]
MTQPPANTPAPTDSRAQSDDDALEAMALADRAISPYTTKEKIGRVLWNYVGQKLFRCTFHNWYGLRNAMLRAFGATIGSPVRV